MTRWLQAAKQASGPMTEPTKPTEPPAPLVVSEKSVLSEGVQAISNGAKSRDPLEADVVILAAIRSGNHRPGAIATQTRLGATVTYQLLDRLIAEGRVAQARDGKLSVVEGRP